MTPLEALRKIGIAYENDKVDLNASNYIVKCCKALEIILRAKDDITEIIWRYCKTSEEFKLIKEILK